MFLWLCGLEALKGYHICSVWTLVVVVLPSALISENFICESHATELVFLSWARCALAGSFFLLMAWVFDSGCSSGGGLGGNESHMSSAEPCLQ